MNTHCVLLKNARKLVQLVYLLLLLKNLLHQYEHGIQINKTSYIVFISFDLNLRPIHS